jgi:hypothetical protein
MGNQVLYPHMQNYIHRDRRMHTEIPVCIRAGIAKIFAYGDPRSHNKIVRILGATYMLLPIWAQFRYANRDSPYAKFLDFLPVRIWGVPVCIPGSVCDVSAIFPHTISLLIRGSPFANFVLISAACTPVPCPYAYRDHHLQILY